MFLRSRPSWHVLTSTPKFLNDVRRVGMFLGSRPSWHVLTRRAELALSYAPSRVGTFLHADLSWKVFPLRRRYFFKLSAKLLLVVVIFLKFIVYASLRCLHKKLFL